MANTRMSLRAFSSCFGNVQVSVIASSIVLEAAAPIVPPVVKPIWANNNICPSLHHCLGLIPIENIRRGQEIHLMRQVDHFDFLVIASPVASILARITPSKQAIGWKVLYT